MIRTMVPGGVDVSELLIKTCGLAYGRGKIDASARSRKRMEKCPSVGEQIPRLDRREQFASPGRFWSLFPSHLGSAGFVWGSGVGNCRGLRCFGFVGTTFGSFLFWNLHHKRGSRS